MILVGIDDTDTLTSPGTNQIAKALATQLAELYRCLLIVRHQLLQDSRVPYTSKNSAASLLLDERNGISLRLLIDAVRGFLQQRTVAGSDPGFCVARSVPDKIKGFGKRCQKELCTQQEARRLAAAFGIHLEGCGGTEDGVIGALAAIGLLAGKNDGRVVQIGSWPDDLSGLQDIQSLRDRGVEVRCLQTAKTVPFGFVDVGKHLRPNYREGKVVLHACEAGDANGWQAVRFN